MALFGRSDKEQEKPNTGQSGVVPVVGRKAYCYVCGDYRSFSHCWLRSKQVIQCTECGQPLPNAAALYAKLQPACSHCGALLEQPGFDYGLCDGCGSRYELVPGTKPGLLPNRKQRAEMNKHGKSWSVE